MIFLDILCQSIGNFGILTYIYKTFPVSKNQFLHFEGRKTGFSACSAAEAAEDRFFNLRAP
jgi:hypothetical protein